MALEPRPPRQKALMLSLLAALILIEIVTVAAIVLSQQLKTNEALSHHTRQLLDDVVDETRENAGGFLTLAQAAVQLSRGLFTSGFLSLQSPAQLEGYFFEQLRIVPHIDGIFFGDPQGQFLFTKRSSERADSRYVSKIITASGQSRRVERVWRDGSFTEVGRQDEPADEYDPRQRPWYQQAIAESGLIWTDPYIFFTSRQPGLTVAAPVLTENGDLLGVVGADVELRALSEFLATQDITTDGAAFIMHRNGEVLAYPDASKLPQTTTGEQFRLARLAELDDVTAQLVEQLAGQGISPDQLDKARSQNFKVADKAYLVEFAPFLPQYESNWIMGIYAPEEYFIGSIRAGQRQSIVLALLISVLITIVAFFLGPRMLRPLARLQAQALQDPLTMLLNRSSFFDLAARNLAEATRNQSPLCALMVDIDHFKRINDEHGHAVGDEVLTIVAERIRRGQSRTDVLARLGGDEFALLLPDTEIEQAAAVAERIRVLISDSAVTTSTVPLSLTVSLGVAQFEHERDSLSELLHRADQCLLDAKRRGRNRAVVARTSELAEHFFAGRA